MQKTFSNAVLPLLDDKKIQEYLLIEKTRLCPADIIIIFGNQHCINELSEKAASLYHTGYAPKIIASGGLPVQNNVSEAQSIRNSLLAYGIHSEDILVENNSTNTQENITNTQELIKDRLPNHPVQRVIGIGTVVAGRRFLMTLAKHWPEALPMISNVNPFNIPSNKWITDPKFQEVVTAEYNKIQPYIKKGFIDEINLHTINKNINLALKNDCSVALNQA